MVEYKDRLAAALKRAEMNPTQLAKALGMSYQGVKKAMEGKSTAFTAENNAKAARALNVSSDWLATGEGAMERDSAAGPHESVVQALDALALIASPRSLEVIDQLKLLAKKDSLGDEDWDLISRMAVRFQSKAKKK